MAKLQNSVKKRKRFNRITYRERVIIENRYCVDKKKFSEIAKELNRPTSTISREIAGKPRIGMGKYSADRAQTKVEENRKKQGRKTKLNYQPLKEYLIKKLRLGWSPEQIALRLPIDYPEDRKMRISYEAIYQYIYSQIHRNGNGTVKSGCQDLRIYLARRHTRRAKKGLRSAQKVERLDGLPSIEQRPIEAQERKVIGHLEDDCLVSRQSNGRIKSINERVSGVILLGKMKDGKSNRVVYEKLNGIPSLYLKTLTRDRGRENLDWQTTESKLGLKVYFAHPYSSFERGSNENLNGLVRRFFPKKTDFDKITDEEIHKVEYLLNTRPRKRFSGKTPLEILLEKTGVAINY